MTRPTYSAVRQLGPDGPFILRGTSVIGELNEGKINYNAGIAMSVSFNFPLSPQQSAMVALWWGELGGDVGIAHASLIAYEGRENLWSQDKPTRG